MFKSLSSVQICAGCHCNAAATKSRHDARCTMYDVLFRSVEFHSLFPGHRMTSYDQVEKSTPWYPILLNNAVKIDRLPI